MHTVHSTNNPFIPKSTQIYLSNRNGVILFSKGKEHISMS